jgi:lipopolysaccharide/colanic/teichoic acid biosynthesis glycosyltransferase
MEHSTVSQPALRRAVDVVASLLLLILFAPALLGAMLALMIEGAGPVFTTRPLLVRAQRVQLIELRTEGTDRFDPFSPVGRFLWITRINQLPMLVNVLRGELSFEDPLLDYLESVD